MSLVWGTTPVEVYTEASGTFTFNDSDVDWVYVDWDDGEDNSLEKAIYQWKELDTDSNTIELTHTYTKTGSFYPVIRTVNSAGFISKYFYDNSKSSTTIPDPKQKVNNISGMTVQDGNPLPTLKVEDKVVKSGIDNSIFAEGPKQTCIFVPPIISSSSLIAGQSLQIKVKYVDAVTTYTMADGTDTSKIGYERVVKEVIQDVLISVAATNGTPLVSVATAQIPRQVEILEIKLITPKWVNSDSNDARNDFNKLKIFLIALGDDSYWYPITYVSSGDPIKRATDRISTLDFSQSRTKASNTSLSTYKVDDGKVFWSPIKQWQATSSTDLTDTTKTSDTLKSVGYTYYTRPEGLRGSFTLGASSTAGFATGSTRLYNPTGSDTYAFIRDQFPLNDFNQFYEQYHLTRMTCATGQPKTSTLDTFKAVYRITPVLDTDAANNWFLDMQAGNQTGVYTSGSYYNTDGYPINVSGWNTMAFIDPDDKARGASEYLILANDVKTNKIFFNTTPYAKELMSNLTVDTEGNKIAGVYYLRLYNKIFEDKFTQRAEWVPLDFTDTTKVTRQLKDTSNSKYVEYEDTLTKPGFIEFDMPSDWAQISASGLTGGITPGNTSVGIGLAADAYSKVITDAISFGWQSATPFNEYIISTSALSAYTDEQIGTYQHTYEMDDTKKVYWVASSNTASDRLYLASGTLNAIATTSGTTEMDGTMRVVNVYDVFDGAPKATNFGGYIGNVPNASATVYPFNYVFSSSAMVNQMINDFIDVYPLKIVLTGSHFISGTQPGTELWNALPFNNTSSQTIIQQDNTAYDLSYIALTTDVNVNYAGTYYQAISKGGKVFIKRTGTPIQSISFGGNALGDESNFTRFSADYTTYDTLRLIKRMEAESIRVMWDEQQKDGTYVRFFGYINGVVETHQTGGKRASKPFSFTMIVEEICLIDGNGILMSDIEPLGGSSNEKGYN